MAEFSVTLSQLQSKAEELEQLNSTFDGMIKTLSETEAALGGMWEGEAKKGFHTAFTNDMTQLRNFYNAIIGYVNALRQAMAKYAKQRTVLNLPAQENTSDQFLITEFRSGDTGFMNQQLFI